MTPQDIYALAVLLFLIGGGVCGVLFKTFHPQTPAIAFPIKFIIAATIFRIGFSVYNSVTTVGHLSVRYLFIDSYVLLIIYTASMGAVMYAIEKRAEAHEAKHKAASARETAVSVLNAMKEADDAPTDATA